MSPSLWALLGFVAWTIAIVLFTVAFPRVWLIARRRAQVTDFPTHERHGSERYRRALRAHANAVENLPLFAVLVLVGAQLELRDPQFHTLACVVLPARMVQTIAHVSSGSSAAVVVRASGYAVQMICFIGMLLALVMHATR